MVYTYVDLNMSQLKELLDERKLPKSGRKDDLVTRLEEWDEKNPSSEKRVGDDEKEAIRRQPVAIGGKASEKGPKDDPARYLERRGPYGPPVYDEMGFELDYEKCRGGRIMPSKQTILNRQDRMMERLEREDKAKACIMGWKVEQVTGCYHGALEDQISRDLHIPFHKVTVDSFEEWKKKGFNADPKDFDRENLSKEEIERLNHLTGGSALRN